MPGAGREVGGERVEVHVVEGQAHAVVAEVGEQAEGVVETEVGEAVGAVAEAQGQRGRLVRGHVMLTFLMARRRGEQPSRRGQRRDQQGRGGGPGPGGERRLERDGGADAAADRALGERG